MRNLDGWRSQAHDRVIERREQRTVLRPTRAGQPDDRILTLHGLFRRQVEVTPAAPAAEHGGRVLTYAELDRWSRVVAARLAQEFAAGPGDVVAVAAPRSLEALAGVLGALRIGAAYLPIDPAYPRERIRFMVSDARVRAVVSTPPGVQQLPVVEAPLLLADGEELAAADASSVDAEVDGSSLAYVIYTSGSTGMPKGVMMPHAGPVNLFEWQRLRGTSRQGGRTLQFSPLGFDVGCQELFVTWGGGGTVVVVDEPVRRDPLLLADTLADLRISRLFLPYIALQSLAVAVELRAVPMALAEVVTAGEQLVVTPEIRALFTRLAGCTLENQYGPTESHAVTSHLLGPDPAAWPELPPIGLPVQGLHVSVRDDALKPLPPGMVGELCIGGICLARGYLGRDDLTQERFVPDPTTAGRTIFCSGDLATADADGVLFFHGRADRQVKIRGQRVELGEVEMTLMRHPNVREAAVVVEEAGSVRRLVAYVVADAPVADDVRPFAARFLPDAMVPSVVRALDRLPRMPSGKLDRDVLAAGARGVAIAATAAATPDETFVLRELHRLLGAAVNLDDSVLGLGVDSLAAAQFAASVHANRGTAMSVAAVLEAGTVRSLANLLAAPALPMPAPQASAASVGPASSQQRQFWLLNRFARGVARYNELIRASVSGPLDEARFADAVRALAAAHEPLRTTVRLQNGSLVQRVQAVDAVLVERLDLRGEPDARESALARIRTSVSRPFDVEGEVPLRTHLLRLADDAWMVGFVVNHIAIDGQSVPAFVDDFGRCYDGAAPGELAAPLRYLDYAAWQTAREVDGDLAYWVDALRGAPVAPRLADDAPRRASEARARHCHAELPAATLDGVAALAASERATPAMVLLAAFARALGRHTGAVDIVVGLPVANRELPELTHAVGAFVNTLPIRVDLSNWPTRAETVRRVRAAALAAYTRQHVPLADIVSALRLERADDRPLVPFLLTIEPNYRPPASLGECSIEWHLEALAGAPPITDANLSVTIGRDRIAARMDFDPIAVDELLAAKLFQEWQDELASGASA